MTDVTLDGVSPISFDDLRPGKDSGESVSVKSSRNSNVSAGSEENDRVENATTKRLKKNFGLAGESSPDSLRINPLYTDSSFKEAISLLMKAWREGCAPSAADVKPALNFAFRKPFPHLVFPDFFQGPIDAVEETLLAQKFSFLSTDLLQLSQTKELSRDKAKEFADLTATLRDEVRPWVETITNTELSTKIDMRGAKYAYTDHLVCHDDRLSTRKIAYVYYLTDPSWSLEDGGSLDLFESSCLDDVIVSGAIEKSILPVRNSMVLFVVGDDSFHQVGEVLSTRKVRLSLTGWFHSQFAAPARIEMQDHSDFLRMDVNEATKEDMENCFLARENDQTVKARRLVLEKEMRRYQGCTVRNLMADSFYRAIVDELRLKDQSLPWSVPANQNQSGHYKYLDVNSPKWPRDMPVFGRLLRLILTDIFLNSLTEIARAHVTVSAADAKKSNNILTPATKKASDGAGSTALTNPTNSTERWLVDLAQCRLERFDHRCYTLKTFEAVQMDDVLDLFYFIDCDLLEDDCGGAVVVVDINESTDDWEPIVSLNGESNGLVLIRREKDAVLFTEYINQRWARRNGGKPFYRLWMSFPVEEPIPVSRVPPSTRKVNDMESGSSSEEDEDEESDELVEPNDRDAALSSSGEEDDEEE